MNIVIASLAVIGLLAGAPSKTLARDVEIQTSDGPIEAEKGKMREGAKLQHRKMTADEILMLNEKASDIASLQSRYAKSDATDITPELLDKLFSSWLKDHEASRPGRALVVNSLAAALGNLLVQNAGYEWRMVTDEYGTTLGVVNEETGFIAYPIDSILKRATRGEAGFIAQLYYAAKDIKAAE